MSHINGMHPADSGMVSTGITGNHMCQTSCISGYSFLFFLGDAVVLLFVNEHFTRIIP